MLVFLRYHPKKGINSRTDPIFSFFQEPFASHSVGRAGEAHPLLQAQGTNIYPESSSDPQKKGWSLPQMMESWTHFYRVRRRLQVDIHGKSAFWSLRVC